MAHVTESGKIGGKGVSERAAVAERHRCCGTPPLLRNATVAAGWDPLSKVCAQSADGALDRIRTYGLLLRRQTLYPLSYEGVARY